ncbi:glucan 1,3-beta-glucosidase [Pseudoduganella flava]|uniref:Cellulase family glycosylhydrolase n=1 Tax=Pseudoduganella flava TaxID=871742 RepID=A0A562PX05_9BURK|nr:cellulase family glycosylhydrolase [Pseudoduganella flava]QGZ39997.1 cellulase family glycosylhydrolase [Pseudoduganella flava]TWI48939.1 glucan 1,3-beta-glucosidase [Pseudoduganella flava]
MKRLMAALIVTACGTATAQAPLPMLRTAGTQWQSVDGKQVVLRGTNLGNWLINEFWMMELDKTGPVDDQCKLEATLDERFGYAERERLMRVFRDNWITTRDWDLMRQHGLNAVRLPFIHTVIEDEKQPRTLRADAWRYLDDAIDQAERRGMYVILDLHGAAGSQGIEHHSGCANRNQYWTVPENQARTEWLWQQIARRYKDRGAVAGYSVLNEPWGTDPDTMAANVRKLYAAIRAVDTNHVIILPGHSKNGIDAYGKPRDHGMTNVAFEMHPYPGHFGWGKPGLRVHRDWLTCAPGPGDTVCKWDERLHRLDTAFFIGEMQPWAMMGLELGGQVARASFDTYAKYGWAATAWSWKVVTQQGGQGDGKWGFVTNAPSAKVPALDFTKAPKADIEALFRSFGTQSYELHQPLLRWLTTAKPLRIQDIHDQH